MGAAMRKMGDLLSQLRRKPKEAKSLDSYAKASCLTVDQLRADAVATLGMNPADINIAVCGCVLSIPCVCGGGGDHAALSLPYYTSSSGAGKSSFINTFLGRADGAVGSAKVARVQCTLYPRPVRTQLLGEFLWCAPGDFYFLSPHQYCHPDFPNLKIWDMPGGGTDLFPSATYFISEQRKNVRKPR